jgi:hypothetical protein
VTTKLKFPLPFGVIEPAMEQEWNSGKVLVPFLKPEVDPRSSSSSAKVAMKKRPSHTLLRPHPPPLKDPLGEFPLLRRIRTVKPRRK